MRTFTVIVLGIAVASISANACRAQVIPINENHYKVYDIAERPVRSFSESYPLVDASGTFRFTGGTMEKLASPVNNLEGYHDSAIHYSWWRIHDPQPGLTRVHLDNRFGPQRFWLQDGRFLLVRTFHELDPRMSAQKYKCYDAEGPAINQTIVLHDEFGEVTVMVTSPAYFCNPATLGNIWIADWSIHLACYEFEPAETLSEGIPHPVFSMFNASSVTVTGECWFCVPSSRSRWLPTETRTWGQIKSLYSE